jgi:multisubunit Na+/H+ antiporter MnhB subunit
MGVMLSVLTGLYTWGSTIDEILWTWQDIGIFRYVLPFLLIFAVVFGLLTRSKALGENRGVNVVVAIAVGLLALQFDYVPEFFATIFPYLGVGISILLAALILTGFFSSDTDWWNYTFFGIGMFIAVIIVIASLSSYNWSGSWWWGENWQGIITLLIIGLLVTLVAVSASKEKKNKKD